MEETSLCSVMIFNVTHNLIWHVIQPNDVAIELGSILLIQFVKKLQKSKSINIVAYINVVPEVKANTVLLDRNIRLQNDKINLLVLHKNEMYCSTDLLTIAHFA